MLNVLWIVFRTSAYFGHNEFHQQLVETEQEAHELAQQESTRHGHASVHLTEWPGGLLFSYVDGELFTDRRGQVQAEVQAAD